MARFYGTVQGQHGEASRLGHSSLYVTAQSYSGDVLVHLSRGKDDEDVVHIAVRAKDRNTYHIVYQGPIAQLLSQTGRKTLAVALTQEELIHG